MRVKLDTSGFDKIIKNAEKLQGSHQIPAADLFDDKFMRANTRFQTWDQMLDTYGVKDSEDVETPEFDQFVAEFTEFADFQSMSEAGASEYMSRKLFE